MNSEKAPNSGVVSEGRHWGWGDRLNRWMRLRKISPYIKGSIIDMGCGQEKALWRTFADRGITYVGIDPLVKWEEQDGDRASFVRHMVGTGKGDKITLPDNSFDRAVSLAVLEHVDDPYEMIAEKFRLLKPGGLLVMTTPSRFAKPVLDVLGFFHIINPVEIAEHRHYYNRKELKNLIERAGFEDFKYQIWQLLMNQLVIARKPR